MPGTICSVAICNSNSVRAKKEGEKIKFFTFPKNPEIYKEWVRKCYRKDKWNPKNKRICSKHFTEYDYQDSLRAKLLNIESEKLKPTAIPSLHLLPDTVTHPGPSKRKERKHAKERKQTMEEALTTANVSVLGEPCVETVIEISQSSSSESEVAILRREMNVLIAENERLKILLEERDQ